MREAVGFAAGLTLGAAAVAAFTTEAGRRLVRELGREAEPDLRSAAEEWQPMLQELARAVRLGAAELTTAIDRAVAIVGSAGASRADESATTDAGEGPAAERATDLEPEGPSTPDSELGSAPGSESA